MVARASLRNDTLPLLVRRAVWCAVCPSCSDCKRTARTQAPSRDVGGGTYGGTADVRDAFLT